MTPKKINENGYTLAVIALALPLLWIGAFKYTPTEAAVIQPLIANHPGMSWMYAIMSEQMTSNLIGTVEIIIAIGLIASFWKPKIGVYAAIASTFVFLGTLSFLFTTPGVWKMVDGFPTTEFFILKDLAFLAISLMVWGKCAQAAK
ncbi:MAG: DUF417 family protein [Verrucomicrobiales bacterium]